MSQKTYLKHRFMGLSLAGGKTSRTHLAVIDYFPSENKVFLTHLFRDIGEQEGKTSDTVLLELIHEHKEELRSLAVDAPLTSPKCIGCELQCPGAELCKEKEIRWMWQQHKNTEPKKRPNKIFTPYTERCVEQVIAYQLEQPFPLDHTLGSNRAPLWARTYFLKKRLKDISLIEVIPRVLVWRIGRSLRISKTPLLFYKNSVEGAEHREQILNKFIDAEWLFIYSQDTRQMVRDAHVFEAVFSAYTAFLHFKDLCELPPKGFPKEEAWVQFPKIDFQRLL